MTSPELVTKERDRMKRLIELDNEIADLSDERDAVQDDLLSVREAIERERQQQNDDETWIFFHPEEAASGE